MRALSVLVALAIVGVSASATSSQGRYPQERQGRYVMSPADNGFARLDTETGDMAVCTRKDGKWACEPMDDEAQRMRAQIDQLTAENRDLKAEVDRLDKQAGGEGERSGALGRPGRKLDLPSEQDVDKAFDYVEGMIRKFRDRLKDLDHQERRGQPL
jgi:hypothetical protein